MQGPANHHLRILPDLNPHPDPNTDPPKLVSPLGFIDHTQTADKLRSLATAPPKNWLSMVGLLGILIAFGHSILAMSGEETLAQVYREVESRRS